MHRHLGAFAPWGLGCLGSHPFHPYRMDSTVPLGLCMHIPPHLCSACACISGRPCTWAPPPEYLGFQSPGPDARLHVHGVLGSRCRSSQAGGAAPASRFPSPVASRARAGCTRSVARPAKGGGSRFSPPPPPRQDRTCGHPGHRAYARAWTSPIQQKSTHGTHRS